MKRLQIVAVIALIALGLALGTTAWPRSPRPASPTANGNAAALQSTWSAPSRRPNSISNPNMRFTPIGTPSSATATSPQPAPNGPPRTSHGRPGALRRGPEIVPGWRLRLNVSNSGSAYDLLLEDVNDPKCGYAALTDERGTIRQAKSLECPIQ